MPAQFIAEEGDLAGLVISLDDESSEWSIGRDPDESQIVVEDSTVSRKHCTCKRTDEGIVITNLSSTNPISVNDKPLETETLLYDGDKVKIGSNDFRFHAKAGEKIVTAPPKIGEELPTHYDTVFSDEGAPSNMNLSFIEEGRWLLKVMSGPNTGAEFSLTEEQTYTLGTDSDTCNIIFHDLSTSKQHAKISIDENENVFIEDLNSRNGVLIDGKLIEEKAALPMNTLISLGTTSFLVIDKDAASETIISPPTIAEREKTEEEAKKTEEIQEEIKKGPSKHPILIGIIILAVVVGIIATTLFQSKEAHIEQANYNLIIENAIKDFPEVKYTFNESTGELLLLGHILNSEQKNQIIYNLNKLNFISDLNDNTVVDEYVWQEMNQILAKNSQWKGVNMHAYSPGKFILKGYLATRSQADDLNDYIHLHFNYLDRLENAIIIEENILGKINTLLTSKGLANVTVEANEGIVTVSGHVSSDKTDELEKVIEDIKSVPGIRHVKNFAVVVSPEYAIMNISDKHSVSGHTKQNGVSVSIIIDGNIYQLGDEIGGKTITTIRDNTILLEDRNGFRYRIDY